MKRLAVSLVLLVACRDRTLLVPGLEYDAGTPVVVKPLPQPKPETCNGKDDDLDGVVDNNLALRFCYTGDTDNLAHGVCRPGVIRCTSVGEICFGEVRPLPELCNGLDDNCNGQVDEGYTPRADIVVVVDNSSSMSIHMDNVRRSVSAVMQMYELAPELRWAIVGAPATWTTANYPPALPRLDYPLGPADGGLVVMDRQDGQTGGADETVVDALGMINNGDMPLAWNGTQKIILVFSDEDPQVYFNYPLHAPFIRTIIFADPDRMVWQAFGTQYPLTYWPIMRDNILKEIRPENCK